MQDKSYEKVVGLNSFRMSLDFMRDNNMFTTFKQGISDPAKMSLYNSSLSSVVQNLQTGYKQGSPEDLKVRQNTYEIINNYAKLYTTFPDQADPSKVREFLNY